MSTYTSEWTSIIRGGYSQLIQARDITPAEVLENYRAEAKILFN